MLASTDHPGDPAYLDFSFSGLKTAAALLAGEISSNGGKEELEKAGPDLAAEFQEAVLDVLIAKTQRAVTLTGCRRVLLGGGVSRNQALRDRLSETLEGVADVHAPPPRLATDNAAMVACVARHRLLAGEESDLSLNADPAYPFPGLASNIA
jgi:N6-L-threonylcarbamoyladenine synthase